MGREVAGPGGHQLTMGREAAGPGGHHESLLDVWSGRVSAAQGRV